MKFLIRNNKIIGSADDIYQGPEKFIIAPVGATLENAQDYKIENDQCIYDYQGVAQRETASRLDTFAQTKDYDDANSVSKYLAYSDNDIATLPEDLRPIVTQYRTESRYLALLTAQTWATLYKILNDITEEKRPVPTNFTEIETDLPALKWPEPPVEKLESNVAITTDTPESNSTITTDTNQGNSTITTDTISQ